MLQLFVTSPFFEAWWNSSSITYYSELLQSTPRTSTCVVSDLKTGYSSEYSRMSLQRWIIRWHWFEPVCSMVPCPNHPMLLLRVTYSLSLLLRVSYATFSAGHAVAIDCEIQSSQSHVCCCTKSTCPESFSLFASRLRYLKGWQSIVVWMFYIREESKRMKNAWQYKRAGFRIGFLLCVYVTIPVNHNDTHEGAVQWSLLISMGGSFCCPPLERDATRREWRRKGLPSR